MTGRPPEAPSSPLAPAGDEAIQSGSGASREAVSVVVPIYNEAGAIEESIAVLLKVLDAMEPPVEYEVLAVDDASSDGTAAALARVEHPRLRKLAHEQNQGYGAAIKTGMHAATFGWVAIIDADGTYPQAQLPGLLQLRDRQDMVVGARTRPNAHIPLIRRPAKWVLRTLASFLIQRPIPDLNSGMRVMRRSIMQRYERLLPDQFSLTTTITLVMLSGGYGVRYEPIDYHKRTGSSKIHPVRDVIGFLTLIFRTVLYFNPLRVFIPTSLFFAGLAVVVGVASTALGRFMDVTTVLLFVTAVQLLALGAIADLINRRSP